MTKMSALKPIGILFTFISIIIFSTGCQTTLGDLAGSLSPAPQTLFVPDYNAPENQFVEANFNTLASEFIDEYTGQYVVIRGRYASHQQNVMVTHRNTGRPMIFTDVMSANIYSMEEMGSRTLTVIWAVQDRDLGRPFLNVQAGSPVTIYGYVLPYGTRWYMKTRKDMYFAGFPATTILLINAVPGNQ
jgi:hypothetical protein